MQRVIESGTRSIRAREDPSAYISALDPLPANRRQEILLDARGGECIGID